MNDKPLVSVVTGIYNVAKFLPNGLYYILNQTYKNIEVILVDDGSTDSSGLICDNVAREDCRVKVIHKRNGGLGSARNSGIEAARGKYIYFFDVDDEIDENLLSYNVEVIEQQKVDMIIFGYTNVEQKYNSETVVSFPEIKINSNDDLKRVYVDLCVLKVNGFAWNKFYRKSFLDNNNLRFENQRIQQDEVFNLKVYKYLEKGFVSSKILYTYYVYDKGNTRSRFIPDRFDICKSVREHFENLRTFWNLKDSRFESYLNKRFYNGVMSCLLFNLTHPQCQWTKKQKQREMKRIMGDRLTKLAFDYAEKEEPSFEQKLYRKACRDESLLEIIVYTRLFRLFRYLYRKII